MKRVMLLALLALCLPSTALAGSVVVYSVSTGSFVSGSMTNPFSPHHFDLSVLGTGYQMDLNTSFASECPKDGFCTLKGGTVDVKRGTATVFTDSIFSGTIFICTHYCIPGFLLADDSITLKPIDGIAYSATFEGEPVANPPPGPLTFGYASVVGTVPDYQPSTLELLLGTGVLGLAEITRRKFKLGNFDPLVGR